jgi:hypothetical protein
MTAHGADPDKVDEETFRQICVMYSDGVIGNNKIIETLGSLTAGVYNYMRSSSSQAYTLRNIIDTAYEYIYPPQDTTQSVNERLLTYVSQAKGFKPSRFKVK